MSTKPLSHVPERRMPQRLVELELAPPYDLFRVTANLAFSPQRLAALSEQATPADLAAAMGRVITEHDIVDEDGEPLPAASDPTFWTRCPADLIAVVMGEVRNNIGKLTPRNGGR